MKPLTLCLSCALCLTAGTAFAQILMAPSDGGDDQVTMTFEAIDQDASGAFDFEEHVAYHRSIEALTLGGTRESRQGLLRDFQALDLDDNEEVDLEEFRRGSPVLKDRQVL